MEGRFYDFRFFDTYHFCQIINSVLHPNFDYARKLDEFCGDLQAQYLSLPFPRWSALHRLAVFVAEEYFEEVDLKFGDRSCPLYIEDAFSHYGIEFMSLKEWSCHYSKEADDQDSIEGWYQDMTGTSSYNELLVKIAREVFVVLFANRSSMYLLNKMLSEFVYEMTVHDPDVVRYVSCSGRVLRRRPPQWAARAVFYRDRGRCCTCQRDLTGLLSPHFASHMDHIVPLAAGGINDVTNLQLMCNRCNSRKRANVDHPPSLYQPWYEDGLTTK